MSSRFQTPTSNAQLTLGFSPCPNDTFMFDAMVHHKIDTEGLEYNVIIEDVESLNRRVLRNELDISKVSFAAYVHAMENYILMNAGSALGTGVGPLVVATKGFSLDELSKKKIAIPGLNTTANFLFDIFFPGVSDKKEITFSQIEDSVLSGKVDAGILIHESRFTYEQKGLVKICDLGELWEKETSEPIPLGGIAVKRSLPNEIKQKADRVMRRSVEYAFANPSSGYEFVKRHAQEMNEDVRKKHIALYVNEYSIDLGEKGKRAVETLFRKAKNAGVVQSVPESIFVDKIAELSNG
jgi:1,4-dihydroxy-6-naphthoate synthase